MKGPPLLTTHTLIMINTNELTISQACERYDINRNTLLSWVRNNKVESSKKLVGKKPVHHLNEASLRKHLARRRPENPSPADKEASEEAPSSKGALPPRPQPATEDESNATENGASGAMKKRKLDRENAKRKKQNHVQFVKNSMRKFSIEDLARVNAWIGGRMLGLVSKPNDCKPEK